MKKLLFLVSIGFLFFSSEILAKKSSKLEKRIVQLERQLEMKKSDKKAVEELVELYLKNDQAKKAVPLYRKLLDDNDPNTYLKMAEIYRKAEMYLDEVRILSILAPKNPTWPLPYYLLGEAYLKLKRTEDAIAKFREAIEIETRFEKSYLGLLKAYEIKENYYESRVILLDLVKNFGDKSYYLNQLCRLYSLDSFFEDSILYCRAAIDKDPSYAENHVYLGLTYKYKKNTSQAEKILLSAANQFRKSEFAQETAGTILEEKENWEKALGYLRQCTRLNKENYVCLTGRARAAFALGKYKEANAAFLAACKQDRAILTEYKKSASALRNNGKKNWAKQYTSDIEKCYR